MFIFTQKKNPSQNKTKLQIMGFQKKPKLPVSLLAFALDMIGYIICECADVQVASRLTLFETYGLV